MRINLLPKLAVLSNDLERISQEISPWMREAAPLIDPKRRTTLLDYNTQVIAWLQSWVADFQSDLSSTRLLSADSWVTPISESDDLSFASVPSDLSGSKRDSLAFPDFSLKSLTQKYFQKLKDYFIFRDAFLPRGLTDCTYLPFMSAHLATNHAAHFILSCVDDDISAAALLHPRVNWVLCGRSVPITKMAVEGLDEGLYEPSRFATSEDGKSLIDLWNHFEYLRVPDVADGFFRSDAGLSMRFTPTGSGVTDFQQAICHILGVPGKNYLKALYCQYKRRTEDRAKFGYHVLMMAQELYKSSSNLWGNEERAHASSIEAVRAFYGVWMGLPALRRRFIAHSAIYETQPVFEDYLLALFSTVDISLLPEEVARVKKNGLISCAGVLSSVLFSFLSKYPGWYAIPIERAALNSNLNDNAMTPEDQSESEDDDAVLLETLAGQFEQAIEDPRRKFLLHHRLYEAFHEDKARNFTAFSALIQLVPVLSSVDLKKIRDEPKGGFCRNGMEVIRFLYGVSSADEDRMNAWNAFSETWLSLSWGNKALVSLFHIMGGDSKDELIDAFYPRLKSLFSAGIYLLDLGGDEIAPHILEGHSWAVLCQNFITQTVAHAPLLLSNERAFITYMSVFDSSFDFKSRLSMLGQVSPVFDPVCAVLKGEALVEFIGKLSGTHQAHFGFSARNALLNAMLEITLPILVCEEQIESLWRVPGCCLYFFSPNKVDRLAYHQITVVNQQCNRGELTPVGASIKRVGILRDLLSSKGAGPFATAVDKRFCKGFFDVVHEKAKHLCPDVIALKLSV